ncbi:MAG: RlmE family RNA methyltransferase [Proteobacteria bacterium]|nr:RlmE family RNA methyltransferase [Pseudomonadota bacterium]
MSGAGRAGGGGRGARGARDPRRLRTGKGRTVSSSRWLARQLSDPYVAEARRRGLRSRAAFKLEEIDRRFRLLKPGMRVVDLGAAPGGWTQVAVRAVEAPGRGRVVAVDLAEMAPVAGAVVLERDALDPETPAVVRAALGGLADAVLSDMAPPATGHAPTDHLRIMALCEAAFAFALQTLAPGGTLLAKVFQGGAERELLSRIKRAFRSVRHVKPPASRKESAEVYLLASGFRSPSEEEGGGTG